MASRIQGITAEIGGDTTKLTTALKGVNSEIRNTQSQLRDVEKLLKLDPGNTELLSQKQRLLNEEVQATKEKLEALKTASEQANAALEQGTISKDQYDALQREIIATEQALEDLEEQAEQSAVALQKIANAGESLKFAGDKVTDVGKKMSLVSAGIVAEGLHEAIIDLDLWEGARVKREETGVKWVKTHSLEHEHILTGLLKCPVCGVGMSGTVRRRKNKSTGESKDDFYYRCKHRKKINESDFCNCSLVLNQNELNGEVERHIMDLVNNKDGRDFIIRRMESRVDVSSLETEREQLRGQLRQMSGAKKKLTDMIDLLDVTDKHYDRKYQNLHDRLDNLYDRIGDIDEQLQDVNEKIRLSFENQITSKQVYQILTCFDKIYFEMTDLEKKEFFRNFIDEIELYSERQSDGRIVKQINFNFPVYYKGNEGNAIRLPDENTVESPVLLQKSVG